MKLTDTFIKRKQGNGKAQKHADGGGLFLYISPKGTKSWRLAYRYLGKHKLLVIGPYPAISLKEARERRGSGQEVAGGQHRSQYGQTGSKKRGQKCREKFF